MEHYATILNGTETLAADILTNAARDRFVVRYIDEETRRDAGIDAVVGERYTTNVDDAMRHANAWVTQTPVSTCVECAALRRHDVGNCCCICHEATS